MKHAGASHLFITTFQSGSISKLFQSLAICVSFPKTDCTFSSCFWLDWYQCQQLNLPTFVISEDGNNQSAAQVCHLCTRNSLEKRPRKTSSAQFCQNRRVRWGKMSNAEHVESNRRPARNTYNRFLSGLHYKLFHSVSVRMKKEFLYVSVLVCGTE